MSSSPFIPKLKPESDHVSDKQQVRPDSGVVGLQKFPQYLVLGLFLLLPLFFVPKLWATLGFDKVILTLLVSAMVVGFTSFMSLRLTRAKTVLPFSLLIFWGFVVVAFVSALYSGDTLDSLRGSVFEVQTVGFLVVLGLSITIPLILQGSRAKALNAVFLFFSSATILLAYSLARIIFGAEFLSFSSFNTVTVSPVGDFNDIGILSGLIIVLSLISLVLLRLKTWLQWLILVVVAIALTLLAVINFFNLWLAVGFFSFLVFVFLIARNTLFQDTDNSGSHQTSALLFVITTLVCVVSAVFIMAGDLAGNSVAKVVVVDYAEVTPSFKGTLGIARGVYEESALLGIGPNRFADGWRLHKDPNINQTIFWDTDFDSGIGFVPTLFVNLGLLGGSALVAFHLWFLYLGYRMFIGSSNRDPYWFYVGVSSFAMASFVWLMSYIYEPGATILLIGALFTGLTFVSSGALVPSSVKSIKLVTSRQRGFLLMTLVIVIISATFIFLLSVGKQYIAQSSFTESRNTTESVEEFERIASEAFLLYRDDRFVNTRAQIKLSEINILLNIPNPTEEDQQRFLTNIRQAQIFIEQALIEDPTNPDNHAILAAVYSSLAVAGTDGAKERALASLEDAQQLDNKNPGYYLAAAQMAARVGDLALARSKIAESLELKPNYTEALYLLAQLDIEEGDVVSAIAIVRSIISLEPRNPTRYFQLGMLLSSEKKYEEAIGEFTTAVRIDPQYANARYLLALTYISVSQPAKALVELRIVAQTNQENIQLQELISRIESGDIETVPGLGFDTPVREVSAEEDSTEVGRRAGETDLVFPVNTIQNREDDEVIDLVDPFVEEVDETNNEAVE